MTARKSRKPARMGRPPKRRSEKQRNRVVVMLTDAELREVRRRAGETPLGTWLHELLVRVLRRPRA